MASVPSTGAVINSVVTDSPADHANLSQGDVITKVGTTSIATSLQLQTAIRALNASGTATLTYFSPTANSNVGRQSDGDGQSHLRGRGQDIGERGQSAPVGAQRWRETQSVS